MCPCNFLLYPLTLNYNRTAVSAYLSLLIYQFRHKDAGDAFIKALLLVLSHDQLFIEANSKHSLKHSMRLYLLYQESNFPLVCLRKHLFRQIFLDIGHYNVVPVWLQTAVFVRYAEYAIHLIKMSCS